MTPTPSPQSASLAAVLASSPRQKQERVRPSWAAASVSGFSHRRYRMRGSMASCVREMQSVTHPASTKNRFSPDGKKRFPAERNGDQIFRLEGSTDDGKVKKIRVELFQQLIGIGLKQLEADGGVLCMKALNPFRKQAASHGGDHAEAQGARNAVAAVDEFFSGYIRQLQQGHSPLIQKPSGLGQDNFSGAPFKQETAKFFLQLLHLRAQRRLRQIQFSCGAGYGAFFYHRDKFVKLFQFHGILSFPVRMMVGSPELSNI